MHQGTRGFWLGWRGHAAGHARVGSSSVNDGTYLAADAHDAEGELLAELDREIAVLDAEEVALEVARRHPRGEAHLWADHREGVSARGACQQGRRVCKGGVSN